MLSVGMPKVVVAKMLAGAYRRAIYFKMARLIQLSGLAAQLFYSQCSPTALRASSENKGGSMNNYVLLGACLLFGMLLRHSGRLPDNAAASLNGCRLNFAAGADPDLCAWTETRCEPQSRQRAASMAWVMFGIGCGFFWLSGRAFGFCARNDRRAHADGRPGGTRRLSACR